MEIWPWVINCIIAVASPIAFISIKSRLEAGIKSEFDKEAEKLRSEFRASEERLKSELHAKEIELSTLINGVLSGVLNRQSLLDKRRLEAVERIWAAVISLQPYRSISQMMGTLNLTAITRNSRDNAKFQELWGAILQIAPDNESPSTLGIAERPFLSPPVWAYFSAYSAIVRVSFSVAKVLKAGISLDSLIDQGLIKNLIKAALPHQTDFVETNNYMSYYLLLDELENNLLSELIKTVEGQAVDQNAMERTAKIMEKLRDLQNSKPQSGLHLV